MPQVEVIIETVPLDAARVGESSKTETEKTILKIHFVDKCASSYDSLGQLILASRENAMNALGNAINKKGDSKDDAINTYNYYIEAAHKAGIIVPVSKANDATGIKAFRVQYGFERLKSFLRKNIPSIVYGTNNTAIEDASFATIQDPKLSTIHMLRAGQQGSLAPSGLTRSNLPLRTLPARISMTTLGCPFIHYMQQFFVDFGTNTTADNIYGVNKLSHEISQGKFLTKIELIPLDAYGRYETLASQLGTAINYLTGYIDDSETS
jgi:hypothetical protein